MRGPTEGSLHAAFRMAVAVALALVAAGCAGAGDVPEHSEGLPTASVVGFFERRVRDDPGDFMSYNSLAAAYIQRARETGDVAQYDRAEAALKRSLELLPQPNYLALAHLALVLNAKHRFPEALAVAREAVGLEPAKGTGYGALGDAALALGQYEDAAAAYGKMADLDSTLPALSRLARLHELKGELDKAEKLWWEAHRSTSGSPTENSAWLHVQLGHLHFNRGELREAKRQYERALVEFPGYVHALAGAGRVHASRGHYSTAISFYQRAVERVPLPEYVIALGDVFRVAGRGAEAQREYGLVGAIDRLYRASGVYTDLQMALFAADHGEPLEAVARARAARETRSDIFSSDALAWALYQAGQYAEAMEYSRDALRLGTRDALMMFHAGMIAYGLGDLKQARVHLEAAVATNPRFSVLYSEEARRTLDGLRRAQGIAAEGVGR